MTQLFKLDMMGKNFSLAVGINPRTKKVNVLTLPISLPIPDDFHVSFKSIDQCEKCLDLIFDEIVPLTLNARGLHAQASAVTALSGDFRPRFLELYSILDHVIQLLDIDRLDSSDLGLPMPDKNMSTFNCLSDACYALMMYNDARSYTSPKDVAYYLKFSGDFAQSAITNATAAVPNLWQFADRSALHDILKH